ncbi:hypothetical protein WR25_04416 [Diploscapter pachys]|uniref:Uncharacterized protein n=1 Tax=Diploscapter pachys TaxID=2018661 RepID=A0A2A2J8Q2_9BILA|nr:hypothetical protein WR25_04416 [Diploscapter pachys]
MVRFVLIVSLVVPNLCKSSDIDSGYRTLKNYYEEKHRNIYGISILDRHRDLGHIEVHHLYSDSTNSSSYTNDHRTIAAVKTFKPAKKKPKVNVRKLLFPYKRPNVILKYIDRLRSKMEIDYDIEILMVHDIKRLGGGWQYGPQNKTTIHLKKPLYVVKRTKRDAPRIDFNLFGIAHKADLAKGKGEKLPSF